WLSLCARRGRESRHRRLDLHVERDGGRNGCVAGRVERSVSFHCAAPQSSPAVAARAGLSGKKAVVSGFGESVAAAFSRTMWRTLGLLKLLHDFYERHHVDGGLVGRAAEFSLLRRGGIAQRDAQAAANTQVGPNGTHHPAVTVGLLDDA